MKAKFLCILILIGQFAISQEKKFNHILITNDDGIENVDRLMALAKSVSQVSARVSIVVSTFDRSGTSNHTTFGKYQSSLEVTCEYVDNENNIAIYTLAGNPADCVLIGLNGLFGKDVPDLVLSGINGGANIGPRWFGSGTIGAVRMAAYLGVPGIALSGFDDDDKRAFKALPKWITSLLSTELISEIKSGSYLTIGFPEVPLDEVKGVVLAERRIVFENPKDLKFVKIDGDDASSPDNKTIWTLRNNLSSSDDSNNYDDVRLDQGYIVITPMTIDENNTTLFNSLIDKKDLIPEFSVKD